MTNLLARWFRRRLRRMDRNVLFPEIARQAQSIDNYNRCVEIHQTVDYAWSYVDEWKHEAKTKKQLRAEIELLRRTFNGVYEVD